MSAPRGDDSSHMKSQPSRTLTALDAHETILQSMEWTYQRAKNHPGIGTAFILPSGTPVELQTHADAKDTSLLLTSILPFRSTGPSLLRLRRRLENQSANLFGISLQFRPRHGIRLVSRFWVPAQDHTPEEIVPWLKPVFEDLLAHTTRLFSEIVQLGFTIPAPKPEKPVPPPRLRPSDDFHLPS